ncbi:14366_t:CDS:2, partial [Racocetra fulgida]
DGTKFRINIYEEDIVFFNIKIKSEELIPEYKDEFLPDYHELFMAQPFDSTEEYRFLRLFYLSLRDRKKALDKIIEKIEYSESPKLLLLYWDIETTSLRGPGYLPSGEEPDDYVYMIQINRFCLTTIPINHVKFLSKYGSSLQCDPKDYHIIQLESQQDLILKFAELYQSYSPDIEFGFNTGGYDWNFILRKSMVLEIYDQFVSIITNTKSNTNLKIQEIQIRVVDLDIEKVNQKYEFAGININNRKIKVNPMETMKCEFLKIPRTIFIDLLIWSKKTFQTEIKNTLDVVLK